MLLNEQALQRRIYKVYSAMKKAAGPKYWKSGRRVDRLRIPGTELPFTKEQLWAHALNQVGEGRIACPYCVEAGRNLRFISLEDCVFDHHVPKHRGGGWELSNLRACCQRCNTEKGKFSYEFFIHIVSTIENWPDMADRSAAYSCLRSHGVAQQFRRDFKSKKPALSPHVSDVLNLDNF